MNEPWLVYFLIFGAVFITVQYGYTFFSRDIGARVRINRRLADIQTGRYAPYSAPSIRRAGRLNESLPAPIRWIAALYIQAGGKTVIPAVAIAMGGAFASTFLALLLLRRSLTTSAVGAVLAAVGVGFAVVIVCRKRRIRKFSEQLPEVIETIVRSLRAGHPFIVALGLVARELPDPAGSEIGMTTDEIAYGREISTALENLYDRVGHEDLRFFATAVTIQSQTGGNLAEILTRLSRLLRERFRMRRKVRSLSAEGRMSALVL